MNLIIAVASMAQDRLIGFMESLAQCQFRCLSTKFLVMGTGEEVKLNYLNESVYYLMPVLKQLEKKPRLYGEIIKEKINFIKEFADDDSIVVMIDDDYDVNHYFSQVAMKVFSENEHVDYISLLKASNVYVKDPIKMSGFLWYHWHSCMGGSVIVRWKNFKNDIEEFFEKYGTNHMWDQIYWDFLTEKHKRNEHIYTLYNFSLVQHCNMISHYSKNRGNDNHVYGMNYDPRMNPFKVLNISEIRSDFTCGYK